MLAETPEASELQPASEVLPEPLGTIRVVLLPGLAQRLLDVRLEALIEALGDVASLVDPTALNGGGGTEGIAEGAGLMPAPHRR